MNKKRWKDMLIGGAVVLVAVLVVAFVWNAIAARSAVEWSDELVAGATQGSNRLAWFFAVPDTDPGSGGGGPGGGEISERQAHINKLLSLRKDIKDKAFSWQPHKRAKLPHLFQQMQEEGLDLFRIVREEDGSGAAQKIATATAKYSEFSAAVLAPVIVLPGHVPGWYKRAIERTAGPLDDAIRDLGE